MNDIAVHAEAPASSSEPAPRAAAALVVVRDGPCGLEVLLLRRAERGDHNSGAWVFPGGLVDPGDRLASACAAGLDARTANERLGLDEGALDHYLCAIRECFEECGLLFADGPRPDAPTLRTWRQRVHRGELAWADLCRQAGWVLRPDRLAYLSHWLTPKGRAKRFDTRFFVAVAPAGQDTAHDELETVEHGWFRPEDALARDPARFKLMTPTRVTLDLLSRFAHTSALMAWARAPRQVALVMPRIGRGPQGERPVMPDEPAWAEIGRLDPQGHGHASYALEPGVPVRLSERVIRITAPNGSVMTGPGTNTYLVGGGAAQRWTVIDPGPPDEAHVQAILAAATGPIEAIVLTHSHQDHSPAAWRLRELTGAPVAGRWPAHPQGHDAHLALDVELQHGQRLSCAEHAHLRVWHTPGHASNHLCFLLEEEKLLFTGDHVMQSSTVVINPPDGDMTAYLDSLRALLDLDLDWLAPGHGFLMAEPRRVLEGLIAHRLHREALVLQAVARLGPASVPVLREQVYADLRPALHAMAERSLLAHLLKLQSEGRVRESEAGWIVA
ncbi:MBL fold metallo-hydrolase [Caldimonas sp.]|uniref:MBL fold metallo-hydrolase n=1 Tax=Caldimonas sp. TaxID=2838790 RepID=UPI00307FA3C1